MNRQEYMELPMPLFMAHLQLRLAKNARSYRHWVVRRIEHHFVSTLRAQRRYRATKYGEYTAAVSAADLLDNGRLCDDLIDLCVRYQVPYQEIPEAVVTVRQRLERHVNQP